MIRRLLLVSGAVTVVTGVALLLGGRVVAGVFVLGIAVAALAISQV